MNKLLLFFTMSLLLSSCNDSRTSVVLISIDGLRYDDAGSSFVDSIKLNKGYSCNIVIKSHSVFPSTTLVNHASMLTGLKPEEHKVFFNEVKDVSARISKVTIFEKLKGFNLKSISIVGKSKFTFFNKAQERFYIVDDGSSEVIYKKSLEYFKEIKPNLMFIHFSEADRMGHEYGWGSSEYLHAVREIDLYISKLLVDLIEIEEKSNLIVLITSDHGGKGFNHNLGRDEDLETPFILKSNKKYDLEGEMSIFKIETEILKLLQMPKEI